MHTHTIHAATAIFPGCTYEQAIARLSEGVDEHFGTISLDHIQLCPQNRGVLDEPMVDRLRQQWPGVQFRLHANVRIEHQLKIIDLSNQDDHAWAYFRRMAVLSQRLGAPLYSLHAGYRAYCSPQALINQLLRLQDLFQVPVAVEGGYPGSKRPLHLSSWQDHAWLLEQEVPFVIDLSHLNIIRHRSRECPLDLVQALLDSPYCREIHVSSNDGLRDAHRPVAQTEWWYPMLIRSKAVTEGSATVFSEGNQLLNRRGAP